MVQLASWFADRLSTADAAITGSSLLPGGAVQHNWRIDIDDGGVPQTYVLRAGPDVPLPESLSKAAEFAILRRAYADGVPVPEPLWFCDGAAPFFVSHMCPGDARRDQLIRATDNVALLGDLGAALARIHTIKPPADSQPKPPAARVETLAAWVEKVDGAPFGLMAGVDWLHAHAPEATQATLVHRDFRTGNFLVHNGRLVAVLDWEFSGWGDPHEDIGWFCAACWRGEALDREAGGLGDRSLFYEAYMAGGANTPNPDRVRFWEVFAHLRWAIIALQQGARARAGAYPAWELEEAEARVPGLLRIISDMTR
tara:strand:- start:61966 stop:62901 length:936 start_codon:yes stop_codon:yes gene_type:complete